ncbi:MAG: DUF1963 domain-containing protein [Pseudomonadota bacterium]
MAFQCPAIGLKPIDTPDLMQAPIRFGGDPKLPPEIAWPEDASGRPMHHLMQIDCASLDSVDPDAPTEGTLFLFITGSYEEDDAPSLGEDEGASALIYWPSSVTSVAPRTHPPDAPALGEYSYALESVEMPVQTPSKGLFGRLFDAQPKPYSKTSTGFFAAVALEPFTFESHPGADPVTLFQALGQAVTDDAVQEGIRPVQMFGHVPAAEIMQHLDAEGLIEASTEKAVAAYQMATTQAAQVGDKAPVLLLHLPTNEALNFDAVGRDRVLKVLLTRGDLKARAFEQHQIVIERLYKDGTWRYPAPEPDVYQPPLDDLSAAVIMKPLVPGEAATSPANYFCGWPRLPADMDWPRNARGEALHFLAQLDLSTVPRQIEEDGRIHDLPPLPNEGILFVFANMFMEDCDGEVKVVHAPGSIGDAPYRQPPEDLAPLRPGEWNPAMGFYREAKVPLALQDIDVDLPGPSWEPRLPFDPVTFVALRIPEDVEDYDKARAAMVQSYQKPLPHDPHSVPDRTRFVIDWMPNWLTAFRFMRADDRSTLRYGVVRKVPDSYPWRWSDVQEAAEAFFSEYRFAYPVESDRQSEVAARQALWPDEIIPAARDWYQRSIQHGPLDRIDQATRDEFRTWLMELDAAAATIPVETQDESDADYRRRRDLEYAFFDTLKPLGMPELSATRHWLLHDETADDIPDAVRDAESEMLRFQRSYSTFPAYNVVHEPSPHQLFPAASYDRYTRKDVLLFEFSSGYGLTAQWADGCWLQIWIDPQDLAEQRFDRITAEIRW